MSKTDDIEHALRLLNEAFATKRISETEYERQDARLRARQAEIKTWREGQDRGLAERRPLTSLRGGVSRIPWCHQTPAKAERPSAAIPGGLAQSHLPFPRRPIRLDLPIRLLRR